MPAASCLIIFGHILPALNPWPSWPTACLRALAGLLRGIVGEITSPEICIVLVRDKYSRKGRGGGAVAAHTGVGGAPSCSRPPIAAVSGQGCGV